MPAEFTRYFNLLAHLGSMNIHHFFSNYSFGKNDLPFTGALQL